ncbi:MAG TPA: hypothetical protein VFV50_19775 [Bdellovibrionales bacterium]|nr:hypothetical protein [Bdellovibrionales bacterium]
MQLTRAFSALSLLGVSLAVLASLTSACTVKLSGDTPGAKKSCNQDDASIIAFTCGGPYNQVILQDAACTGCHINGAAGGNAMQFDNTNASCCGSNTCLTQFATVTRTNFCTALLKGTKLVEFPQSDAHTADKLARQYTASEIQGLIDWVNDQQGN